MKKLIAVLRYLLSVHILALFILFLFRIILYLVNSNQAGNVEGKTELLFTAILNGIQFDNMVGCYIIALPLVVLLILALCNKIYKPLIKAFNIYFIVLYTIVFAVSAADIPYFSYYFSHLGGSILNWVGFGGTAGMIFQESSYYLYFALFLVLTIAFGITVFFFGKKLTSSKPVNLKKSDYLYCIPLVIIIFGLCFVGLRGRLGRYPLRVSGAYFCNNSFFNQLGLNPAFYLLKSTTSFMKNKDKLEGVMNAEDAIAYVQKVLNITPEEGSQNPIARAVKAEGEPLNANVVVVFLESLASVNLNVEYNGALIMPFFNEMIGKSYYFDNFYSAGVHTNNGIVSTLYGYPPIFERTMMAVSPDYYTGLPVNLKEQGYQNMFFMTHDPQYDHMNSFLMENGFDKIYSQYDYPSDKVVNNFGVQDDFLFEYGLEKLNNTAKQEAPFFATFMTVSNHPPYVIPDNFKNAGSYDMEQAIAFMDASLKDFMKQASEQSWYKNTIFVFLGDHGKILGEQPYEMVLSYNHVPLIIYSPLFDDVPKQYSQLCGQVDVFPTVMGLLNRSYENNSLGEDLFKTQRPYMYFVSDNHLGCISDEYFYIYNPDLKTDGLFDYRNQSTENLRSEHTATADSMKNYAVSMMITADYLVKNKLTGTTSKKK